jgi:hypothetical protein
LKNNSSFNLIFAKVRILTFTVITFYDTITIIGSVPFKIPLSLWFISF